MKFNVGDCVKCVDNLGTKLSYNKTYTINKIVYVYDDLSYLYLDDTSDDYSYCNWRFIVDINKTRLNKLKKLSNV